MEKQGLLRSEACGLLRDGDPRHRLVRAGPGHCSSATTYGEPGYARANQHTVPCSGAKKGRGGLAEGLGWEQGYRHGCAWPRALCFPSGLAASTVIRLRPCAGHHGLPQGWAPAPSPASGLGPGPISSLRAGPRHHRHSPQGWPQAGCPGGGFPHRRRGAALPRPPFLPDAPQPQLPPAPI